MSKTGKEKRKNLKTVILILASVAAVLSVIVVYSKVQESIISEQIESSIEQSTLDVAGRIDSSVGYALNSIQVVSNAVSGRMTGPELGNSSELLNTLMESTPFGSIEYIRSDGMNLTNAGDPFDASDREYFRRGIAGETGIWINYYPKYSKEPLLNFYTPLYYEGKTAGVLTGTIGGNSAIAPMLLSELYDHKISGMLLDSDNHIIASSETFKPGVVLEWDNLRISEKNKQKFLDAVDAADGTPLVLYGDAGRMTASISEIDSCGWKVVHILSGANYVGIMNRTNNATLHAIVSVLAVSILLFAVFFIDSRRNSKEKITKANTERDETLSLLTSMNGIYYSVHLIDLPSNSADEFSAENQVREVYHKNGGTDAASVMKGVMYATMSDEYLETGLSFSDVSTVAERLKGRKFISMDLKGKNVGWIRMSFITIETDSEGIPEKVVCTTQIIDEDKKREEALFRKSNTDEMTGCRNRRAYEDDIAEMPEVPDDPDFVYVSIDINELKVVNDNLGHNAGDELIKGAVYCMKQCLGNYGRIYRTGGDEFIALISADEERLEKIKSDLDNTVLNWSGELVDRLTLSCGYVSKREFPEMTITEIAKTADKRMYEAKSAHYRKKGVDRRGQSAAHTALCALYTKILKINITDDTYQIVNMDTAEQTEIMGFSNSISSWLSEFGKSGQVHPDDLDEYLRMTDIGFLSQYFKEDKTSVSIHYRRKYGDSYRRVVMDMIPANDYTHENQSLFLYVKSIEK